MTNSLYEGDSRRAWWAPGTMALAAVLYGLAQPPFSFAPFAVLAIALASAVVLEPGRRVSPLYAMVLGGTFSVLSVGLMPWVSGLLVGTAIVPSAYSTTPIGLPARESVVAVVCFSAAFFLLARLRGGGAMATVVGGGAIWSMAERVFVVLGDGSGGGLAMALFPIDSLLSRGRVDTPMADLVAIGGQSLVAFLVGAVGCSFAMFWVERRSRVRRGRALAAGAAVVIALALASRAGSSSLLLREEGTFPSQPLRIAIVQPGVDLVSFDAGGSRALDRLVEHTRSFETRGADLVVWPSFAGEVSAAEGDRRRGELLALAKERGVPLLIGGDPLSSEGQFAASKQTAATFFSADGSGPVPLEVATSTATRSEQNRNLVEVANGWTVSVGGSGRWSEAVDLLEAEAELRVSFETNEHSAEDSQRAVLWATTVAAQTRRPVLRMTRAGVSALIGDSALVSWQLPVRVSSVALLDVVPPRRDSVYQRGGHNAVGLLLLVLFVAAAGLPTWLRRLERQSGG